MKVKEYSVSVFIYSIISALFALLALGLLYPWHPSTIAGSVFWFLATLPVWMIGEGIGSIFINDKIGKLIHKDTSTTSFKRIGYGILAFIIILIIFIVFVSILGQGLTSFFENNFSNEW